LIRQNEAVLANPVFFTGGAIFFFHRGLHRRKLQFSQGHFPSGENLEGLFVFSYVKNRL